MTGYKYKILMELQKQGWELSQLIDKDLDWWADEQWLMESVREHWAQVYITFLVDPQWSGNCKKGQEIWSVMASSALPVSWSHESSEIASLSMSRGKFDSKLERFVTQINSYRINLATLK